MNLWIVDAFEKKPFKGNQAAIILVSEFPETSYCQNIAAEMNLSETVFVKKLSDQKFSIREVKPGEMLHCKECRQVFSDDVSSTTFTLTQRPVKSPLSIKVINKGKGSIPLIPSDDDLVDL